VKAGPGLRLHLALGLVSVAVVAQQLVLMQLLAITQWHHFAYLIISVALLGFGASGTLIALFRARLLAHYHRLLPVLLFSGAMAMAAVLPANQRLFGGFDSYLLFFDPSQMGRLLAQGLLFTVPFLLAALVIGLIFVRHVEQIGSLYFANLLGSGLGGLVGVAALSLFYPERLPALVALFAAAAGLLLLPPRKGLPLLAASACAAVLLYFLLYPPPLLLSQYKDLRGALELPQARIHASSPSPYGLVQAVSAPALRHSPGLSLGFQGSIPARDLLFNNGNGFGPVPLWPPAPDAPFAQSTAALPYALARPASVLVLHGGSGEAAAQALAMGASKVVLVEPHRAAVELLRRSYPRSAGQMLALPESEFSGLEPRAHLANDARRYDLILLPAVGSFGAAAGLFALQEQHSLTLEGIAAIWDHLLPEGLLCAPAWLDHPPRNALRLAATLIEALEAQGVADPGRHLAAVRGWNSLNFCLKRSALSSADIEGVRSFSRALQFDPLLLPGLAQAEREHFHRLQDKSFFALLDGLFTPERKRIYEDYPFRLRPTTDDRPFFSQFLRRQSLPELGRLFDQRSIPFLEMGYLVALLSFIQMTLAAVLLILLPLLRLGWKGGDRFRTLLYFGGLGTGYMLVEIDLIHRFVLYLGHPVYAAAAVICALLVFSGLGSYASSRLPARPGLPHLAAALVCLLLLLYGLVLPVFIEGTIALELPWKLLLCLLILAPPSVAMGLPFPLGLRQLSARREADIPWAWGINGCLSVLGTSLATLIALEAGFTAVFLLAATAYAVAALSGVRVRIP